MIEEQNLSLQTSRGTLPVRAGGSGSAVRMGAYVYTPASGYPSLGTSGTLNKEEVSVALRLTESVLQGFLDSMDRLESDTHQRWESPNKQRAHDSAE